MNTPHLHSNPAAGLIEDALAFHGLTQAQASRDMKIPRSRITDIFAGRKGVSADTALRAQRDLGIPAFPPSPAPNRLRSKPGDRGEGGNRMPGG